MTLVRTREVDGGDRGVEGREKEVSIFSASLRLVAMLKSWDVGAKISVTKDANHVGWLPYFGEGECS